MKSTILRLITLACVIINALFAVIAVTDAYAFTWYMNVIWTAAMLWIIYLVCRYVEMIACMDIAAKTKDIHYDHTFKPEK